MAMLQTCSGQAPVMPQCHRHHHHHHHHHHLLLCNPPLKSSLWGATVTETLPQKGLHLNLGMNGGSTSSSSSSSSSSAALLRASIEFKEGKITLEEKNRRKDQILGLGPVLSPAAHELSRINAMWRSGEIDALTRDRMKSSVISY